MKRYAIFAIALISLVIFVLAFADTAQAAIVHCGRLADDPETKDIKENQSCTVCDILVLGENIIDFGLKTAVPVAAILFLWAGFLILLSGARPSWISKGKDVFRYTTIGLFIMFGSWLVANTILKSLAGDDDISKKWNEIQCQETIRRPGGNGTTGGGTSPLCSNPAALAQEYGVPSTPTNAPELIQLISCIQGKVTGDLGEISTFDKSKGLCNYTRGDTVCGPCSHKINSCHYGGRNGNQGALAVDFGNQAIGDQIIKAANECRAKFAECENRDGERVNCSGLFAAHVHVSTRSCSGN